MDLMNGDGVVPHHIRQMASHDANSRSFEVTGASVAGQYTGLTLHSAITEVS
jgi:hypothetical protein